ncbi:MAG TPA: V-type ATP synthase subunit I [bacterium]|nr:V-type ATP synthase subunit I [bacterium]
MAVRSINKKYLVVPKDKYQIALEILQSYAAIQLEPLSDDELELEGRDDFKPLDDNDKSEYWLSNIKFALNFLKDYLPKTKKAGFSFKKENIVVTENDIERILAEFPFKQVVKDLENQEKAYNENKNVLSVLRREEKLIANWKDLAIHPGSYSEFEVVVGSLPVQKMTEFEHKIKMESHFFDFISLQEQDRRIFGAAVILGTEVEKFEQLAHLYDWQGEKLDFKDRKTIKDLLFEIDTKKREAKRKLKEIEGEIQKNIVYYKNFQILHDYYTWRTERYNETKKMLATKSSVVLQGWVPEDLLTRIKQQFKKAMGDEWAILPAPLKDNEEVPVEIQNHPGVLPFEAVTDIYGNPKSDEPDPTILLAPFFIVYFGLCLTDAGYGVILSLLAGLGIYLFRPTGGMKKLLWLMVYGGAATFILGALFGGWFGLNLETLPWPWLSELLLRLRVLNPNTDPITVLILTLILGIVQIVIGLLIGFYWKIKQKKYTEAFLDSGLWALSLILISLFVLSLQGIFLADFKQWIIYSIYGCLLALVLTQGRHYKGIVAKLGVGVISLYNFVGYFSDVLSFSRLLALGLATGIIAMVVNLIAGLVWNVAYVGWLLGIIILVGGHLFNLAINVLGAYIHSGRLQFVEFFPKFMEGGGRKFKPIKQGSTYIKVKKEKDGPLLLDDDLSLNKDLEEDK